MSRTLVGITYRKLLVEGKRLDADAARRGLLCASAQQFYDHYTNKWSSVDSHERMGPAGEAEYVDDRKLIDPLIRELNNNRDWYHPPPSASAQSFPPVQSPFAEATGSRSKEGSNPTAQGDKKRVDISSFTNESSFVGVEQLTVSKAIAREFRRKPGNLSAGFTALKMLSNISALCDDRVPTEPLVPGRDYGFEVVDGRTKGNLDLAMRDPAAGQALSAVVRQRQLTVVTSHPVLHGFFRHSIILVSGCSRNGSVGFIVNKPLTFQGMCVPVWSVIGANFHPLFSVYLAQNPVMLGGPVASPASRQQALYILHRVPNVAGACQIAPNLWMSGNYDELFVKLKNKEIKPTEIMVMMGYSGWGVSQLEGEIIAGSWATLVKRAILPMVPRQEEAGTEDASKKVAADGDETAEKAGVEEKEEEKKTKKSQQERSAYDIFRGGLDDEDEEHREGDDDDEDDIFKSAETEEEINQRRERHLELVRHPVDETQAEACADLIFSTHAQCYKMVEIQNLGEGHQVEEEKKEQEEVSNKAQGAAGGDEDKAKSESAGASSSKKKGATATWDRLDEFMKGAKERDRKQSAEVAGSAAAGVAVPPPKKPEDVGKDVWVEVLGGLGREYEGLTRLCNLSSDAFHDQ